MVNTYSEWLLKTIEHLKKDCANIEGEPIVPLAAKPDSVKREINKYVDEEKLKSLFGRGADPLSAAQEVCN